MDIDDLVLEIKRKKELKNISEEFVKKLVLKELEKRSYLKEIIEQAKNIKELKKNDLFLQFFKEIRKILHEIYGVFAPKDIKKIWKIINSNISFNQKVIEVLKISRPTKERLNFYKEIYSFIFLEDPKEILDLASGLNPISIYFSDRKPRDYFFVDISTDIILINEYFLKQMNINPYGYEVDLFDPSKEIFEHYQYIFLWKTIPLLEKIEKNYTKDLLRKLNFDYLIISFSKKSLSGKRNLGRAWIPWIKKIISELGYNIKKEFEIPNEYFVIIY